MAGSIFRDKVLLILISLFLILRLAVLFSYLDKLYEPEELYRGTIAREIIKGPLIPLREYLDYKVEYFPGGVLTVGILAVPFFLLFGQTYIALKLVGLSFALGTFILWYLFLGKFFNKRTALICGLLFIFCPPFYTETSLITWGSHPEANFFTVLSLFVFYLIFFKTDKVNKDELYFYRNNGRHFFFLGLTAGFGLWFVQSYLLTLSAVFLYWFIFDKRFFLRKAFYIFFFGFLIGFVPAIYYMLFYKGQIFSVNGKAPFIDFLLCDLNRILPKAFLLLVNDLPNSFLFENIFNLNGMFFSYLYYLIFLISFLFLIYINQRHLIILFKSLIYPITLRETKVMPYAITKESLLVVYPILFFLIYTFSGYAVCPAPWDNIEVWRDYIGYRYMIPVTPFILVLISIFIEKIKNKKWLFNLFLFSALGLGLIGNLSLISLKNFGRFFEDKGYSYNVIGDKIGLRVTQNLAEYIKPFEKLEPDLRRQFYEGLGAGLAWGLRNEDIERVMKVYKTEIMPQYQPCLYRGWGTLFFPQYPEEYRRALYIADNIPHEYRPFFYEGFGRNMDFVEDIRGAVNFIDKRIDKGFGDIDDIIGPK